MIIEHQSGLYSGGHVQYFGFMGALGSAFLSGPPVATDSVPVLRLQDSRFSLTISGLNKTTLGWPRKSTEKSDAL